MSQENVESVRRAFDAINRRDADALLEGADAGIVQDWSKALGPERGIFRGADEVRRFLESWWDAFDESVVVIDDLIDAGDQVVAVFHGRQRGRGSGVVVDGRGSVVVVGLRHGKLLVMTLYHDRAEALAAAGLSGLSDVARERGAGSRGRGGFQSAGPRSAGGSLRRRP